MSGKGTTGNIISVCVVIVLIYPDIFCRLPATAQLQSGVWWTFQIHFTDLLFYSFTHSLVFGWRATPPCAPGCVPINHIYWCNSSLVRQEVQYCVPQCHLLSFHYCLLVLLHCSSSKKTLNPLCDLPRLHNPTLFLSKSWGKCDLRWNILGFRRSLWQQLTFVKPEGCKTFFTLKVTKRDKE